MTSIACYLSETCQQALLRRERAERRGAARVAEGEQELLLRELASAEYRLRSLQARSHPDGY